MGARAFVIAVDFGGTKIDVATAAASGESIGQVRLDTQATRGAEQAVDRAIEAAWLLIGVAEDDPGGICVAAGVVCPGIPLADRVALAPEVDRALDELAVHGGNLARLLDPEQNAVGGGLMASAERVLGALQRRLHAALPSHVSSSASRSVHDGALRGAVALALDRAQLPADPSTVPAAVIESRT